MRNVSDKSVEERKTHFLFSNFFLKSYFCEKMWKNFVEPDNATEDNMAHAYCMLDTEDCKHTLRICTNH